MKRNLLLSLLFFTSYTPAMEVNPVKKHPAFELQQLSDELIMLILPKLANCEYLKNDLIVIGNLRNVNKRLDNIINNIKFVDEMINYFAKKYNMQVAFIAVFWKTPGVLEWANLNKEKFSIMANKIPLAKTINGKSLYHLDSPLVAVARKNRFDLISIFSKSIPNLEKQIAEFRKKNPHAQNLLAAAVNNGATETVKFLLENGAKEVNDIIGHGIIGFSLLYFSIENSYYDIILLLLENGADPNSPSLTGFSNLANAKIKMFFKDKDFDKRIPGLLEKYGARD